MSHLSETLPVKIGQKEVAYICGVSYTTVWRWRKDNPYMPKAVYLSPTTVRWDRDEIIAFASGEYHAQLAAQ